MSERFILARNLNISPSDWANIKMICGRSGVKVNSYPDKIHLGAAMAAAVAEQAASPSCEIARHVYSLLSTLETAVEGTGDFFILKVESTSPLPSLVNGIESVTPRKRNGPVKKFRVAASVWELSDEHIWSEDGFLFQSNRRNRDLFILTMEEYALLSEVTREKIRVGRGVWLTGEPIGTAGHWAVAVDNQVAHLSADMKDIVGGSHALAKEDFHAPELDPGDIAADVLNCDIFEIEEATGGGTFWRDGNKNNRVTVLYMDEVATYNTQAIQQHKISLERRYGPYIIFTHVSGSWEGKDISRDFDPMKNDNE